MNSEVEGDSTLKFENFCCFRVDDGDLKGSAEKVIKTNKTA